MKFKVTLFIILLCFAGICLFLSDHVWLIQSIHQSMHSNYKSCNCEKCLLEDFPSSFPRMTEPLLSQKSKLSEDAFKWWRRLQGDRRGYNTYNETVTKLFNMFPPNPHVEGASPDHCRTCSLVGNSGNLKGSHYGPLIDHHDIIIRMNYGHSKGYETDVGTRTTHQVMYPESATDLDNTTHLVLFPFKTQDLEWLIHASSTGYFTRTYTSVKSHIKANKDLVMVLNPAFMKYVHNIWLRNKGLYPSTGFMALILAMHICDEVHVFGFGADEDGNWSHYFEELKNKKFLTGGHPGSHEYEMIQQLSKQQKIFFYRGQ